MGVIEIIRPVNVAISMMTILAAVWICDPQASWHIMLLAAWVGGCITAGANTINDYFDIEIDRINRPGRPLPAGTLTPPAARMMSWLFFALAFVSTWFLGIRPTIIVAATIVLLYYYSAYFKRTPVWGNLVVSLTTGLAFLFGGVVAGAPQEAWIPAGFAFLINWAREIIKDIEDIPGDQRQGVRTLPIVTSVAAAKKWIAVILAALLALTLYGHVHGSYGAFYIAVMALTVYPLLFLVFRRLRQEMDARMLRQTSTWLKWSMLAGLIAIVAGRWSE